MIIFLLKGSKFKKYWEMIINILQLKTEKSMLVLKIICM